MSLLTRRGLMAAAVSFSSLAGRVSAAELNAPLPDRTKFRTGDLIWPKKKGQKVWLSLPSESDEQQIFTREIAGAAASKKPETGEKPLSNNASELSWGEFVDGYYGGIVPGQRSLSNQFYVGHVGIIQLVDGYPFVVEAVPPKVRMIRYDDWLSEYDPKWNTLDRTIAVWQGRINGLTEEERKELSLFAQKNLNQPYRLSNLDVYDNAAFYCSKLVCFSLKHTKPELAQIFEASLPIPPNPRFPWVSPKMLLDTGVAKGLIHEIHNPGKYCCD